MSKQNPIYRADDDRLFQKLAKYFEVRDVKSSMETNKINKQTLKRNIDEFLSSVPDEPYLDITIYEMSRIKQCCSSHRSLCPLISCGQHGFSVTFARFSFRLTCVFLFLLFFFSLSLSEFPVQRNIFN